MNETIKDNVQEAAELKQGEEAEQGAAAQENVGSSASSDLGKFKSVNALLQAYNSLQAEFTRRSQRLKELENEKLKNTLPPNKEPAPMSEEKTSEEKSNTPMPDADEELWQRANASQEVKNRIIQDYLGEVKKSAIPLLSGGVSVVSPAQRAKNLTEAGDMALGFFHKGKQ